MREAKFKIKADDQSAAVLKKVQSNLRNTATSAAILDGPLGGVAGRINSIATAAGRMNPALIISGVALAALATGLKSSVVSAAELEQQQLRLEAVLNATGNATGFSAEQLERMAISLGEVTLASQQGARDAIAAISSFGTISGEQFQRTLSLAQDLVAVFGGDLQQTAKQLSRALDDPAGSLSLLERNIGKVESSQRELILSMSESGKAVEAQSLLLDVLAGKVGGTGVGEAGGLIGSIDTLGERWTLLKTNVGNTSALESATESLSELFNVINKGFENDVGSQQADKIIELVAATKLLDEAQKSSAGPARINAIKRGIIELEKEIKTLGEIGQAGLEKSQKEQDASRIKQESQRKEIANAEMLDELFQNSISTEQQHIASLEEQEKAVNKISKAYESLFLKSLQPLDKLAESYRADATVLAETLNAKLISQDEHNRQLLELESQYQVDIEAIQKANGLDEIRQSFLTERQLLAENLSEKQSQVETAFEEGFATEIERNQVMLALAQQHEVDLAEIKLNSAANDPNFSRLDFVILAFETERELLRVHLEEKQILIESDFQDLLIDDKTRKDKLIDAEIVYQNTLTEINQTENKKRDQLERMSFQSRLSGAANFAQNIAILTKQSGKEQHGIAKFAARSAIAINAARAISSSYRVGADIGGPVVGKAFALAAFAAVVKQQQALESIGYGGGGSGSVGSGGTSEPFIPPPQSESIATPSQESGAGGTTVIINGNVYGVDDLGEFIEDALRDSSSAERLTITVLDTGQRVQVA